MDQTMRKNAAIIIQCLVKSILIKQKVKRRTKTMAEKTAEKDLGKGLGKRNNVEPGYHWVNLGDLQPYGGKAKGRPRSGATHWPLGAGAKSRISATSSPVRP